MCGVSTSHGFISVILDASKIGDGAGNGTGNGTETLRSWSVIPLVESVEWKPGILDRLVFDRLVARQSARVKVWNRCIYNATALLQLGARPISFRGSLSKM